ncbi:SDR family NAD(P)-dependent oxidoreductase [Alphaproteobacteria bacterium]|nr:SDR family NAD(P)-dependent oxidoreductase [Alphaproteobacteria bacterium]
MSHYFITGASSGIGAALATRLLAEGHHVSAVARREDRLQKLAPDIGLAGTRETKTGNLWTAACDVSDATPLNTAIENAIKAQGPVDVAILNAGIYVPQDGMDIDPAIYAKHMEVNYMGVVNALPALIRCMRSPDSQLGGQIAIVSSVAGWRGLPKAAAYGPTKAALISLAESLRFDLGPRGIDVRVICPGFVETESTAVNDYEMPGMISAQRAADEILAGLKSSKFLIHFPKSFTRKIGWLRWLPDRMFFRLVAAQTGHKADDTKMRP